MNRRHLLLSAGAAAVTACAFARAASAAAPAAELPLLPLDDAKARELLYVEDAAKTADPSHTCASCALYQGSYGSTQGPCLLFPKHAVKAAGSCKSWAPQM